MIHLFIYNVIEDIDSNLRHSSSERKMVIDTFEIMFKDVVLA